MSDLLNTKVLISKEEIQKAVSITRHVINFLHAHGMLITHVIGNHDTVINRVGTRAKYRPKTGLQKYELNMYFWLGGMSAYITEMPQMPKYDGKRIINDLNATQLLRVLHDQHLAEVVYNDRCSLCGIKLR